MITPVVDRLMCMAQQPHDMEDYQSGLVPRWCVGCGDNAILTAVQRLCRDEQLDPARTVFVSGIGCSSRLPHYMGTYGFHGLHGRALPIAEGVKMSRPDLPVFVSTGDGDSLSIGAGHWIHAIRYNMDLTVLLHDNRIYGLTKKQASPTSPLGTKSNTTPKGSYLEALDPVSIALGVTNVSFVAQAVDWIPDVLYQIVAAAYRHKGFSFVRIIQRCPEFMPGAFDAYVQDPERTVILQHPNGITLGSALARVYKNVRGHDPSDLAAARGLTPSTDGTIPVGIFYRNDDVPCYEDVRGAGRLRTVEEIRKGLDAELDRFTIGPDPAAAAR
ncbi:MAG: 2-oxoglutarate oxidoreductase [Chloroflexota bacterium]|nr:2-oxoglutarate oxidoreductase [Chloroflexota bacterium]